jgi:hypothetical protein
VPFHPPREKEREKEREIKEISSPLFFSFFLSRRMERHNNNESAAPSIITTATAFLFVHFFAVLSTCFTHQNT